MDGASSAAGMLLSAFVAAWGPLRELRGESPGSPLDDRGAGDEDAIGDTNGGANADDENKEETCWRDAGGDRWGDRDAGGGCGEKLSDGSAVGGGARVTVGRGDVAWAKDCSRKVERCQTEGVP